MAILQYDLSEFCDVQHLPSPANSDAPFPSLSPDQKVMAWLFRLAMKNRSQEASLSLTESISELLEVPAGCKDDWHTISNICGHSVEDFISAGAPLPLTCAEIDHFRRNHRDMNCITGRDFLVGKSNLPSPLSELYGIYLHRARIDTESALFVAQATGSTRIARIMGDLLAIGGFANGHECISYLTATYSVPAAFDTSDLIDAANYEASRRLAMSIDHPAHLLKLSPDEISILANDIVENFAMAATDFLEKANLLSEARQDVARLPSAKQFITAIVERDLPVHQSWVGRICAAYSRIFPNWLCGVPEIEAIISQRRGILKQ